MKQFILLSILMVLAMFQNATAQDLATSKSSKTTIGGTTFITKQDKTGKSKTYIKSGDQETITSVSPERLSSFMKSGRISDLGKGGKISIVYEGVKKEIPYVRSGDTYLYFSKSGSGVTIYETETDPQTMARMNNGEGPGSNSSTGTYDDCLKACDNGPAADKKKCQDACLFSFAAVHVMHRILLM